MASHRLDPVIQIIKSDKENVGTVRGSGKTRGEYQDKNETLDEIHRDQSYLERSDMG